jgi:GNAT superfamily N-acetyltransferase
MGNPQRAVSRDQGGKAGYKISTDPARLDRDLIHDFLAREAYWSRGVPRDAVDRSIDNSICFGVYRESEHVGFARVVTDRAAIAYLGDVFIVRGHRGRGLGRWLIETVLAHPDLQGLRRFILATADAHVLYQRFGFRPLAEPDGMMEIARPYEGFEDG